MNLGAGVDPKRETNCDAAVAEYQASRTRYIRTLTFDTEQRLKETIGKQRQLLAEEIANLTLLADSRGETYQRALKAYSAKAPKRVTSEGLLAPSPLERIIAGVDKLYKTAARAADEYREVDSIIKKRKDKLEAIDSKIRGEIEQYGRALNAQLETPAGLAGAFRRDPLLARAHTRMLAAQARRVHGLASTKHSEP